MSEIAPTWTCTTPMCRNRTPHEPPDDCKLPHEVMDFGGLKIMVAPSLAAGVAFMALPPDPRHPHRHEFIKITGLE